MFYRLFVVLDKGQFFFTAAQKPVIDTSRAVTRNGFISHTKDSVTNGAETFRFSDLIKDKSGYRLMEDLGTKPRVYYLPPVNRNFPYESGIENQPAETTPPHSH